MRETLKDWKRDWLEANGETHDLEVVIDDSKLDEFKPYVYEGSFADIPEDLIDKKVIKWGQIIESSKPERKGGSPWRLSVSKIMLKDILNEVEVTVSIMMFFLPYN